MFPYVVSVCSGTVSIVQPVPQGYSKKAVLLSTGPTTKHTMYSQRSGDGMPEKHDDGDLLCGLCLVSCIHGQPALEQGSLELQTCHGVRVLCESAAEGDSRGQGRGGS